MDPATLASTLNPRLARAGATIDPKARKKTIIPAIFNNAGRISGDMSRLATQADFAHIEAEH